MERLTRDQIARIFNQEELEPEEVLALIEKELGIKIDPELPKEEQIDKVFEIYNQTLDELDEKKKEQKEKAPKKVKSKKLTRKAYIMGLLRKGEFTRAEIIEMTDHKFEYAPGKTSKVRVNKVIRQAQRTKELQIEEDSKTGILKLT